MRQVWLNKDDFEMFHQDITPLEYEFFRTHMDTFKRMWKEQVTYAYTILSETVYEKDMFWSELMPPFSYDTISDSTILVVVFEYIWTLYLEAWMCQRLPHEGQKSRVIVCSTSSTFLFVCHSVNWDA